MRRWGHPHTFVAGGLVTLGFASYRLWLLLAVAFLLGCAATLLLANGRKLLHWSRDMVAVWKLRKGDQQRERLAALDRRGFPRGYGRGRG